MFLSCLICIEAILITPKLIATVNINFHVQKFRAKETHPTTSGQIIQEIIDILKKTPSN